AASGSAQAAADVVRDPPGGGEPGGESACGGRGAGERARSGPGLGAHTEPGAQCGDVQLLQRDAFGAAEVLEQCGGLAAVCADGVLRPPPLEPEVLGEVVDDRGVVVLPLRAHGPSVAHRRCAGTLSRGGPGAPCPLPGADHSPSLSRRARAASTSSARRPISSAIRASARLERGGTASSTRRSAGVSRSSWSWTAKPPSPAAGPPGSRSSTSAGSVTSTAPRSRISRWLPALAAEVTGPGT